MSAPVFFVLLNFRMCVSPNLTSIVTGHRFEMVSHELQRLKTYFDRAPSEDSDQPAHSRRLIRIFTGRIFDDQRCKVSS